MEIPSLFESRLLHQLEVIFGFGFAVHRTTSLLSSINDEARFLLRLDGGLPPSFTVASGLRFIA